MFEAINADTIQANRCYGFTYLGMHDFTPRDRVVMVEETDNTSVLGRLAEEGNFGAIRRFRFDRMVTEAKEVV